MYFDPSIRPAPAPTETKPDPYKLDTLIRWLEKQPADKEYCYIHTGECLLANYFAAQGVKEYEVDAHTFLHSGKLLPGGFNEIARALPRTYGAALERARNSVRT